MQTLNLNAWGKTHPIGFCLDNYADNNNLYVGMTTYEEGYGEPWSDLTVNLGTKLAPNRAYIDTNNNGNGIINWLVSNQLGKPTGNIGFSGFGVYPEFEFNLHELKKYCTIETREDALLEDLRLEQRDTM